MRKVALAGIIGNPVTSNSSHNGGWTKTVKSILEDKLNQSIDIINQRDDWDSYDLIILTEGVNYKEGSFNFFGGVQQDQITRLEKLKNFKGQVRSVEEVVDYNIVMEKRKELKEFGWKYKVPAVIKLKEMSDKLVLGDSHSVSVFKEGHTIYRNDGKTLKGFLKKGIKSYLKDGIKELIFYAGNIDVRFHLFNPDRPTPFIEKIDGLIMELSKQLVELNLNKVTCVKLLPIENIDRKLPKTGQLDGKNYNGTWQERMDAVNYFNGKLEEMCNAYNFNILSWDFDYSSPLSFDHMEARQSVHLRPSSYMFAEKDAKKETKEITQEIDFDKVETGDFVKSNDNIGLKDFIQYYEKAKKVQEVKYQGIDWKESDVNDDLVWNVPIYDIINRRYAAFSSLLEALKQGYNDPKGNGKYFVEQGTIERLSDNNFIKLCYLFRLCGSGINYKPKTDDEPWGTHGFGNFWVVKELRKGSTKFDDWLLSLPEDKFCDVKGYLLPMIKGGLRNFILKESEDLVKHIMEFIILKGKVGIKDVVDIGNEYLLNIGAKRQNFVLTAFAMDLAEYFPHRVDRDSATYVGSNARKCLKKILPGVKTDEALQFLCDETGNHSKPYDMEDVACDYIRYCENFQSKEHVESNKGIRYERSICK